MRFMMGTPHNATLPIAHRDVPQDYLRHVHFSLLPQAHAGT